MSEVYPCALNGRVGQKQKLKTADFPTKRVALSVIGDNSISKGLLNFLGKHGNNQKIHNKTSVFGGQSFPIFEDCEEMDSENISPSTPKRECLNSILCKESLEFPENVDEGSPMIGVIEQKRNDISSDFVWCTPYRLDIYYYFKEQEQRYQPNANYMSKQTDITVDMRSVLVDWLVEVGQEYKLHANSLYLAVSYTDRFLSTMSVMRAKLQLVGTASMFIATKYEEVYPPELNDFVYITDDTYTKHQILRMEHLILDVLSFNMSAPTAYSFLQLYCSIINASQTVIHLSQYICELSLLDAKPFLQFLPSVVAAGSLALANNTLGCVMWSTDLEAYSGYEMAHLACIIYCLHKMYSSISSYPQQSICQKYKKAEYGRVAEIRHLERLVFPDRMH